MPAAATPDSRAPRGAPPARVAMSGASVDWPTASRELLPVLGPSAERELASWRRLRPRAVAPLEGFVHERIFGVRPEDVEPLLSPPMERWPFPLGTRKAEWSVRALDDLTGGEPLSLAHHRFVEAHGHVPSWPEAVAWFMEPDVLPTYVGPAWALFNATPEHERPTRTRWQKGITWRIGNAYLSFLREMDLLSRMRHRHGTPLRFHVVADAVLKVDFFLGNSLVCVWMNNDYRGRKSSPNPTAGKVHDVTLSVRGTGWNSVMRAAESDLALLAADIAASSGG